MKTRLILLCLIAFSTSFPLSSQHLRTSYFMEGVSSRIQLNPALQPTRGFIDIPALGSIHAAAASNTLGVKDVIEIIDSSEDFYHNNKLYNRLKTDNRLNVYGSNDIVSFGFYKGKGFWTGSIGARADIGASIPKSMLEFARDFDDPSEGFTGTYNIKNMRMSVNAYTEVGVGYSRPLTSKITVGGKVKVLFGVANLDMNLEELYIKEAGIYSEIKSKGSLNVSMSGMGVETEYDSHDKTEYISDVDFDKFGFAGYGMGVDLGATYQPVKNLTVSAAVLDLGFISWKKGSTTTAIADKDSRIDYDGGYSYIENDGIFDLELPGFSVSNSKSHTTALAASLVLGGEYAFMDGKLSAGLLSVTRFGNPETLTEITLSGNYRPKSWLNATLSYSVFHSEWKTFGLGVKIGPVFIGTDYLFLGSSSNVKNVNAHLGISIPLGKKK